MDRLFVNLGADGRVSVSTELDGEYPSPLSEPAELSWPMNADELEDLRWYLEDYLQTPFGVYEHRGEQVANQLAEWGQRVFDAVFKVGPARDAYVMLRTRATEPNTEIVFQSAVPGWLALPWELLRDPHCRLPLALDGFTVSRSLIGQRVQSDVAGGERLRVLMVISRSKGAGDVSYRMIARPLLERLEAVRGRVDLVVLRPPTLDALEKTLLAAAGAGEPFQVVHFDGHGMLVGARPPAGAGATGSYTGIAEQGVLVFEKPGGGADHVPAHDVARVLAGTGVPVVVLNACQSGAVGKEVEAAVATRLLVGGASSVVAMAYRVYAVATAEFMTAFYQRLFAGDRVADAVTAGRKRLHLRRDRPSPKGPIPLDDWMVPVHYTRRDVYFPNLRTKGAFADKPSIAVGERTDPLDPQDTFVGRDGLFYQLEVSAQLHGVVLLHGLAGTGKTELAKAFGRWWRDTGGVDDPNLVIWCSFEPGVTSFGLTGVISTIGLQVLGTEFELLRDDKRKATVLKLLAERRTLVVWDNFESVYSMPDPRSATPTLDQTNRSDLLHFLTEVAADGPSVVVITSRSSELWLGDVLRIPIGGLTTEEASEYADQLLTPYPNAQRRRNQAAFGELMEWLAGHPLSMRLTLRYLDTMEPRAVIDGLRGLVPLRGEDDIGRTASLSASVIYSIRHLSPNTRRLLVAVSLYHGVADASVLHHFSHGRLVPARFRDTSLEGWKQVLEEASAVGLLTPLGGSIYAIHPLLPAYLADQWRADDPGAYAGQRTAAKLALLDTYAAVGEWASREIQGGNAAFAFSKIYLHQRTLCDLLGYALNHGYWAKADSIAFALDYYWNARGLYQQANEWYDRARRVLASATETPLDDPAGQLWLTVAFAQGNCQLTTGLIDSAEHTYREIHDMLAAQPESDVQRQRLAITYHAFGRVAYERAQWGDAEDWYRKCLAIREEVGTRRDVAASYHELGTIALQRVQWDEAENLTSKALTIWEELGDRPKVAKSFHQLGCIAQWQGRLDQAENWHHKSLILEEELHDRPGAAASYHQLGQLAMQQDRLDEAENWYRESLIINEKLGIRTEVARCHRQLGLIAHLRGDPDQAEAWHRQAFDIQQELSDQPGGAAPNAADGAGTGIRDDAGTARHYAILGYRLAKAGQRQEAVTATGEAVDIYRRLAQSYPAVFARNLAGTLQNLGNDLSSLGRREQALEAISESVETFRRLAEADPVTVAPNLAGALNDLGNILSRLGRREQALKATSEAVEIYRRLVRSDPAAFESRLALALTNLGAALSDLERRQEALEATSESVEIRRRLAQTNPAAFEPGLAKALRDLSERLSALGRWKQALKATSEAAEIFRKLTQTIPRAFEPDLARRLKDLAATLRDLSAILSELGRREQALKASSEAIDIYRRLIQANPGVFDSGFAEALDEFGNALSELGRREQALKASSDAVELYRKLTLTNRNAFEPALARTLTNLGARLSELGRWEDALKVTSESVEIRRRLTQTNRDTFEPGLALGLTNLGAMLLGLRRREQALRAFSEAVKIYRRWTQVNPVTFECQLAAAVGNLGSALSELGRWEEALKVTSESVEIYRRWAQTNPAAFEPNLARALNNLGCNLSGLGRQKQALQATSEAVEIYRRWAQTNSAAFEPDLAKALDNLGNCLSELGHREEALDATSEAVDIRRRWAQ